MGGAVDIWKCPKRGTKFACNCDPCRVCGYGKHTAIHGPKLGKKPGSDPWGHEYKPPDPTVTR